MDTKQQKQVTSLGILLQMPHLMQELCDSTNAFLHAIFWMGLVLEDFKVDHGHCTLARLMSECH